ncbi:MAG: ABC transporter ATP-binding protein [Lachnospiraceae bacterium]|nr:ABC transporter ATP-binding protein [Lachnospiraceae bacterium]MEE3460947.1 ABC transporter ATP-binding protein [Lachnospiraceae bacterium]
MPETIVEFKDLRKTYDGVTYVIDNINLKIIKGEFVTLLGPSGCGKTTLLRMLGGFDQPTSGQILLNGKDISGLAPNERPINTVFQKYALFPHLNIYENIAFGLKLKGMKKSEIKKKVKDVLEVVDLEGFEERSISTLSGGQQQRIAIARAIVNEPEILLLDEPLSALDYQMRKEMQLELKDLHEKLGITFIFVTHDQEEALTMSDKIVVMNDGHIQQHGLPESIYDEPANAFVADFIGESNIFSGVMSGERKVTFFKHEFDCVDDYKPGTRVEAVVRLEDVVLTKPVDGKVCGEVISSIFKGSYYDVTVQYGKNEIMARSVKKIEKGQMVGIDIEPDGIHIMPNDPTRNHFSGRVDEEGNIICSDFTVSAEMLSKAAFQSHRTAVQKADDVDEENMMPEEISGNNIDEKNMWSGEITENNIDEENMMPGEISEVNDHKAGNISADKELDLRPGTEVDVYFSPAAAILSDDPDAGLIRGTITRTIYKGDHYSYVVRSENDLDYYVNDEYLWNNGDFVSVEIPAEQIVLKQ